jgi:hypothetical protein
MDPEITHEALRRLTEEIQKEEEAAELAKRKILEEEKAAEARIHEEFIRLRAEEERIRIEAEKLALQAQAKRLAEQKEAAVQAELERLRNRTPVEVLRDDFKALVKQFNVVLKKPDHTEPLAALQAKLDKALEENVRLQAQLTALSTGFQAKLTAVSTELNSVKTAKNKEEAALLERVEFMENVFLTLNPRLNDGRGGCISGFETIRADFLRRKNTRKGIRTFNISKSFSDHNPFTIKFNAPNNTTSIQLRYVRGEEKFHISHQIQSAPHGCRMSSESSFNAASCLTHNGSTPYLNIQVALYADKLIFRRSGHTALFTYSAEGVYCNNNEFFNWGDLLPYLGEANGASCQEQQ